MDLPASPWRKSTLWEALLQREVFHTENYPRKRKRLPEGFRQALVVSGVGA